MSHPVPNTDNSKSAQIILPASQVNRKSDIYIFVSSFEHNVSAQGKYIATISTTVETADAKKEVNPALALLGPVDEYFIDIKDTNEPLDTGVGSKAFISKGYDPVSHFETTIDDVFDLYTRITGKKLNVESETAEVQE